MADSRPTTKSEAMVALSTRATPTSLVWRLSGDMPQERNMAPKPATLASVAQPR